MNARIKLKKYFLKIFLFIIVVYLSNLLDGFFNNLNNYLLEKSKPSVIFFVRWTVSGLNIKIPLFSLLMAFIVVWIFYRLFRALKLRHRRLKIISAIYGKNDKFIDITDKLNDMVEDNKLRFLLSNAIAGDPVRHTKKEGKIRYKYNNKIDEGFYEENTIVELPPKNSGEPLTKA